MEVVLDNDEMRGGDLAESVDATINKYAEIKGKQTHYLLSVFPTKELFTRRMIKRDALYQGQRQ